MTPDEELLGQMMASIASAKKRGDNDAVQWMTQEAQKVMTGEASSTAKFGAGMQDIVTGTKQLFGQTEPGEAAEQEKFASQADPEGWHRMAGQATMLAPLAFVPGAATIPGAIATGAAGGLAMPTQDENVLRGKLTQGAIGGVTGGVAQKYLPKALGAAGRIPGKLSNVVKTQVAERTPWAKATKQKIAERAFVESVPEADRAGVLNKLTSYSPTRDIPGFEQTTAAASGNPALLASERLLREAGGDIAQPLRNTADEQASAVQRAWEGTMGGGQSQAARGARETWTQGQKKGLVLKRAMDWKQPTFKTVKSALDRAKQVAVGPVQDVLAVVEKDFDDAIAKAVQTGDIEPLHQFRRTTINDRLTKMYREGAPQSAVAARKTLQEVKSALDAEMDKLLTGKTRWSDYMKGYAQRSQNIGQLEAGEGALEKLAARPTTSTGTPTTTGMMPGLRKEIAGGMTDPTYGTPKYTPQAERLIRATARETEQALTPYAADIAPKGTATAENILSSRTSPLAKARAATEAAQNWSTGEKVAGVGGLVTGQVWATLGALAKHYALDPARANALNDIAGRVIQMHKTPQAAINAIMAQTQNLPPAQQQYLIEAVKRLAPPMVGAATAELTQ